MEDVLLKTEEKLKLAREAIGKLNEDLGTVVVGDSSSGDESNSKSYESVHAKITQCDALFGQTFTFETNVSHSIIFVLY